MCFCPFSELVRRDTSHAFRHFRCFVFKDNHLLAYVLLYRAPLFPFLPCLENFTMDYFRMGQSAMSKPADTASTKNIHCNYRYLWWSLKNAMCRNHYLMLCYSKLQTEYTRWKARRGRGKGEHWHELMNLVDAVAWDFLFFLLLHWRKSHMGGLCFTSGLCCALITPDTTWPLSANQY